MKTKTCKTKCDLRSADTRLLSYFVMRKNSDWHYDYCLARFLHLNDAIDFMKNFEEGTTYIINTDIPKYAVVTAKNPNYFEATFSNMAQAAKFAEIRNFYTCHHHFVTTIE